MKKEVPVNVDYAMIITHNGNTIILEDFLRIRKAMKESEQNGNQFIYADYAVIRIKAIESVERICEAELAEMLSKRNEVIQK